MGGIRLGLNDAAQDTTFHQCAWGGGGRVGGIRLGLNDAAQDTTFHQ